MTETPQPDRNEPADELVVAAGTDREAFGKLFDRFYPLIVAYSLRRLLVRDVAEDVTSEVFLKVAVHIRDFKGATEEDFRRWLLRIATNEINAQLRQRRRRRELLESAARMGVVNAAGWTPGEDGGERLDWQRLYQALGELPRRQQSIVSLRFFAGLEHRQIADVLEMTPGAVRVALSRTLEKLRDRLRERASPQPPEARPKHST